MEQEDECEAQATASLALSLSLCPCFPCTTAATQRPPTVFSRLSPLHVTACTSKPSRSSLSLFAWNVSSRTRERFPIRSREVHVRDFLVERRNLMIVARPFHSLASISAQTLETHSRIRELLRESSSCTRGHVSYLQGIPLLLLLQVNPWRKSSSSSPSLLISPAVTAAVH